MNDIKYNSKFLVKLQDYSWYFLLFYFLIAFCSYLFNLTFQIDFGYAGVLIVLSITFLKLIVMAEEFRIIQLIRITYIAYLLLLILLITIIVRLFT